MHIGSEMLWDMEENVAHVRENLMTTHDRQKKYADAQRVDKQFFIGDRVFLRVHPWKSLIRYRKGFKFVPQFVRPFKIFKRIGPMAYHLALPPSLSCIHDVFHV